MNVTFCPLLSGSSGNSTFIKTRNANILVDAGASGKAIQNAIASIGYNAADLNAIFITHEHSDHIKGAGILSRRFNVPIYATLGTWEGMKNEIGNIPLQNINYVYPNQYVHINDMCVKAFNIPHDTNEPVGYTVIAEHYKITVATDIGHVNDTLKENLEDSNVILLEANHDVDMLQNGSYPYMLKKRILSDTGHLSNENTGLLLSEIMSENIISIYLGHLSDENNLPEVAYNTVSKVFENKGIERFFNLFVADRYAASSVTNLL